MTTKAALVVGVSGIIGRAVVDHLAMTRRFDRLRRERILP